MQNGRWVREDAPPADAEGRFVRAPTRFRRRIGEDAFAPARGRYRLIVSAACPWAHRTLIMRRLKGLEQVVGVCFVAPVCDEDGWRFDPPEPRYGFRRLYELYAHADPHYTGRVSVPVLWDDARETIVNNESAEIVRMLDHDFGALGISADYAPKELLGELDALCDWMQEHVNNGVYRCGFARTQEAYEEAVRDLFAALDRLEARLQSQGPFLFGARLTEADVRLFPTLVRFDAVYYGLFRCNLRHLYEYPALFAYVRRLWRIPAFRETTDLVAIKQHYYKSLRMLNPSGIVPAGPRVSFAAPGKSMHADVPHFEDCCVCEPEPRWQRLTEG